VVQSGVIEEGVAGAFSHARRSGIRCTLLDKAQPS
jgi:hypothetical protein